MFLQLYIARVGSGSGENCTDPDPARNVRIRNPAYKDNNTYWFRVENTVYREAEDGGLFVVDLAGSENAADSQFHDKET